GVCSGTPKTCTTPPTPICTSVSSLRVFSGPGTCSAGDCNYPHVDMSCACSNGACAAGKPWGFVAPMPTALSWVGATKGSDGWVYVVGGSKDQMYAEAIVAAFSPSAGTWLTVAPLPMALMGLAAAATTDGRIYALGGVQNALSGSGGTVYEYTISA